VETLTQRGLRLTMLRNGAVFCVSSIHPPDLETVLVTDIRSCLRRSCDEESESFRIPSLVLAVTSLVNQASSTTEAMFTPVDNGVY
jgi:hypothetical protein